MFKGWCVFLIGLFFYGAQSQQLPLDFENNSFQFTGFSGSLFSFRGDPAQGGNQVGQFFNDGSVDFQGFFMDLNTPVDLDNDTNVSLRFYAFDPNVHSIIIKLENGINPDVEVVQSISNTQNTWTDLTFDFANAIETATGNTVTASGTYSRLTIFIDGGSFITGTYLIDDIDNNAVTVPPPNPIDVVYTDLVWSDEFNTPGINNPIDATKWHHQTQLPNGGNWFNGEEQHYTDRTDNSYVENGFLHIVAKRENFTDQGETKSFTSARLNSKFAFTYGRVDVRAKLPLGDGTWPAIWTLGKNINEAGAYWSATHGTTNWPLCGEIDVMEHGLGPLNQVSAALHTNCAGCSGATMNYQPFMLTDVANTFHVYSMNWSPQQITFLIDDIPFYTYNPGVKNIDTWPFDADQYMLLNVAMGGIAGAIDPNFTQSDMQIDYVRVYQNTLSLNTADFASGIKIYPNPTSDVLNVNAPQQLDRIVLLNMLGQEVVEFTSNLNQIDLSNQSSGVYLLKLVKDDQVVTKRVVVQ